MTQKIKETIKIEDGSEVPASFPVIISASRATDVPAFFSDWFAQRLKAGYCAWVNPFNAHQKMVVGFAKTRAIVFWSKNPKPLIPYLPLVEDMGIGYYFQFTLNDYRAEGLEPSVPRLEKRIETFHALSEQLGPDRVVWRYDPLLIGPTLSVETLLERINTMADQLAGATRKLVVSFADISAYRKVQTNLGDKGQGYRELTAEEMASIATGLRELKARTGLTIATCAEGLDLAAYGIEHNRCIDDDLLAQLYPKDAALMTYLGRAQNDLFAQPGQAKKDPGQRKECGCIVSKDIGAYNTCPHLCTYCYANAAKESVIANFRRHVPEGEMMIPRGSVTSTTAKDAEQRVVKLQRVPNR